MTAKWKVPVVRRSRVAELPESSEEQIWNCDDLPTAVGGAIDDLRQRGAWDSDFIEIRATKAPDRTLGERG